MSRREFLLDQINEKKEELASYAKKNGFYIEVQKCGRIYGERFIEHLKEINIEPKVLEVSERSAEEVSISAIEQVQRELLEGLRSINVEETTISELKDILKNSGSTFKKILDSSELTDELMEWEVSEFEKVGRSLSDDEDGVRVIYLSLVLTRIDRWLEKSYIFGQKLKGKRKDGFAG